jgi:hypothetical protein
MRDGSRFGAATVLLLEPDRTITTSCLIPLGLIPLGILPSREVGAGVLPIVC